MSLRESILQVFLFMESYWEQIGIRSKLKKFDGLFSSCFTERPESWLLFVGLCRNKFFYVQSDAHLNVLYSWFFHIFQPSRHSYSFLLCRYFLLSDKILESTFLFLQQFSFYTEGKFSQFRPLHLYPHFRNQNHCFHTHADEIQKLMIFP